MKRLCLGLVLGTSVALSAGSALADGMNRGSFKDAPVCSNPFQGFYVGINGGYAGYKATQNDLDGYFIDNAGWTASEGGFTGGVQAGYNWQRGCNVVLGIEADWSWADLDASTRQNPGLIPAPTLNMTSTMNSYGTVRTRTGFVFENLLLYVTGGLAFADIDFKTQQNFGVPIERFSFSEARWGWTVGVGSEWALWKNVTLKSEVLYMDFGDEKHSFLSPASGGARFNFTTQDSMWVSRAGLNFKF